MRLLARMTWVELKLLLREPFAVIFTFVFPLITLIIISGSFSIEDAEADFRGAAPWDYYLASYIGVVIGAVGLIAVPVHLAGYIEHGILRRFRASSIPAWTVLSAQVIVGFLMAVIGSIVLVIAGRAIYGAGLPEQWGGALVGFVIGAVAFLALGVVIAMVTRNARAAQAIGMIAFFPLFLLSGAGPPPDVMTGAMRSISDVLPLTFVVRAIQDPWIGEGWNPDALLLLVGILVVTAAAIALLLRRSI